ncbi:3-methyladenine DNA glycosylase [Leucobacter sp. W1153]|uniref:3-methyladenine DNA glycosylase n=1 Tax=Leucobacter sp. W1153 TaxID=3439064 RepID=UPI003F35D2A7
MSLPVMSRSHWQARERAHRARINTLTAGHRERRARREKHPIEDFLWTYYSVKPSELARWHPGAGVVLADAGVDRAAWRHYRAVAAAGDVGRAGATRSTSENHHEPANLTGDVTVDLDSYFAKRAATVDFVEELLAATLEHTPQYGCFGLHEWAMVYRLGPDQVRHTGLPLRIDHSATDAVVESHRIACTHFDAYRFFTPDAAPLNTLHPTRETQAATEQAGCLHAGMDVYKWAAKLGPIVPGEVLLDAFVLARDIREVDMRASPYDVTGYAGADGSPLTPIPIETPEGKRTYAELQRGFTIRGNELRKQVLTAIGVARQAFDAQTAAR